MAAHLVHHHHHAPRAAHGVQRRDARVQPLEHDLVKTLAIGAQAGLFQRAGQHIGNAITQALAAGLIVQPQHRKACTLQDIQQVFKPLGAGLIGRFTHMREHAGHRRLRIGAAGSHSAVISEITGFLQLRQLGIGVAGITPQRKVGRSRGFTDHQHHHGRPFLASIACAQAGILTNHLQNLLRPRNLIRRELAQAIQRVERIDQITDVLVVAHQ